MTDTPTSAKPTAGTDALGAHLADRMRSGKLLLPYVTAGVTPDWLELVDAVIDAGADAVEMSRSLLAARSKELEAWASRASSMHHD